MWMQLESARRGQLNPKPSSVFPKSSGCRTTLVNPMYVVCLSSLPITPWKEAADIFLLKWLLEQLGWPWHSNENVMSWLKQWPSSCNLLQGWQPPVCTSTSQCPVPRDSSLRLPGTRQPRSLPGHSMCHSSSASAPLAANTGSHAQHRQHKAKQSHALHAYLLDKTVRHFCLLSADEWRCLGCEIGLQIPLWAQLLAGSHLLPWEPFSRAFLLNPGTKRPTASHHMHLSPCRGGVRFMGHWSLFFPCKYGPDGW